MRRLLVAAAALVVLLGIAGVWLRFFAGGPVTLIPGGALSGETAPPPADWSFATASQYVDVESRARALPYSTTTWFMVHEGRLHLLLPSVFGDGLMRRIEEDPRVRVRVDGKVYDQRAVRVDRDGDVGPLLAPLTRRQFAIEIEGPVRRSGHPAAEIWIYRLEDPAP